LYVTSGLGWRTLLHFKQ